MSDIDQYYETRKQLLDQNSTAVRIYCDASLKEDVLVAAIYVDDHTKCDTRTKYLRDGHDIIQGEVAAIDMALTYIEQHFIKEAIIYTEINSILQAHPFTVILGYSRLRDIPSQHRNTAKEHYLMWRHFRYLYSKNKRIVLDKIPSSKNPAHAIACQKREAILHPDTKAAWKRIVISVCRWIIQRLEG